MWIIIITLYMIIFFIDTRSVVKADKEGKLPLYITLMVVSCAIFIANNYTVNMPSPAGPIKDLILSIIGS